MSESNSRTTQLRDLIKALQKGDTSARHRLIEIAQPKIHRLVAKMLRPWPTLSRWTTAEDIAQEASMAILGALEDVVPASVQAFLGLAALKIRQKLIDTHRKIFGKQGIGQNVKTNAPLPGDSSAKPPVDRAAAPPSPGASTVAHIRELHETIDEVLKGLKEEVQRAFEWTYYVGLTQREVAELEGVDVRTIKRRIRAAKEALGERLLGRTPDE